MVTTADNFDVVIIGGGPGGYAAALYGAAAGLQVAMVEKDKVGGTCLHRGCIPAKELLETAAMVRHVGDAERVRREGREARARLRRRHGPQAAGRRPAVQRASPAWSRAARSPCSRAPGTLGADKAVTVTASDGQASEITGTDVILAPGSAPRTIPGFDVDGKVVLTSDEVFELEQLPARVAVIGGGAIGCEFASMMADLGSQVTVLEALPQDPPGCRQGRRADVVAQARSRNGASRCAPA